MARIFTNLWPGENIEKKLNCPGHKNLAQIFTKYYEISWLGPEFY